jgi:hypothetical protein
VREASSPEEDVRGHRPTSTLLASASASKGRTWLMSGAAPVPFFLYHSSYFESRSLKSTLSFSACTQTMGDATEPGTSHSTARNVLPQSVRLLACDAPSEFKIDRSIGTHRRPALLRRSHLEVGFGIGAGHFPRRINVNKRLVAQPLTLNDGLGIPGCASFKRLFCVFFVFNLGSPAFANSGTRHVLCVHRIAA